MFHSWFFIVFNLHQRSYRRLTTIAKLFADDSSLFSVAYYTQTSANDLNKDLETLKNWAFQWKVNFNPESTKQVPEMTFSRKAKFYGILC